MERVIIAGGGTGATMLANTLDRRKFAISVITDSVHHVFQPALLYVAFRNAKVNIERDERRLLPHDVHLVRDRITGIDLGEQVITVQTGARHAYDRLVVATGIHTDPNQIPGLAAVNTEFGDYHRPARVRQTCRSYWNPHRPEPDSRSGRGEHGVRRLPLEYRSGSEAMEPVESVRGRYDCARSDLARLQMPAFAG